MKLSSSLRCFLSRMLCGILLLSFLCFERVAGMLIVGEKSFNAPVFSLQIGNRSEWECFQEDRQVFFLGSDFSYCKNDRSRPEIEEIRAQNGFVNKVAIAIDAAGGEDCPEEEKYFTAELLGFSAFINIRPGLPGFSLNVHNFRQPVNVGKIPFLDVGSDFLFEFETQLRTASQDASSNFSTEIVLTIEGCEDDNPFFIPINRIQVVVYTIDALIAFVGAGLAFDGYRRLNNDTTGIPRKFVLALDGILLFISGFLLFAGIRKHENS